MACSIIQKKHTTCILNQMNDNNEQSIPNFPVPSIDKISSLLDEGAFELLTQLIKAQNDCKKAIEEYKKFREERKRNDGQTEDLHKVYIRDNDVIRFLELLEKQTALIAENQRLLIAMITVRHGDNENQDKVMVDIMNQILNKPETNISSIISGQNTDIIGKNKK